MVISQSKTTNNNSQKPSLYQLLFPFVQIDWCAEKKPSTSPRDVETRKETGQDVEAIVSIRPNGKRQNLGSTHHDKGCFLPKASADELSFNEAYIGIYSEKNMCLKWVCLCIYMHSVWAAPPWLGNHSSQVGCTLHIWTSGRIIFGFTQKGTVLCALVD